MLTTSVVRRDRGAALMAAVVALAVIAILATAAIPVLAGTDDFQKAYDTENLFLSLHYSINNATATLGRNGFQTTLGGGKIPSKLSQLIIPITGTDRRCSGATYTTSGAGGGDVTVWSTQAPYSGLYIVKSPGVGSGVLSPIGMVKDSVFRALSFAVIPTNNVALGIDSVSDNDVSNLETAVDGVVVNPSTTGTIRWIVSPTGGAGLNYVFYIIPTTQC